MVVRRFVILLAMSIALLVLSLPSYADSIVVGTSTGTGFIVSSDGYIITNEHVVEGSTEVTITLGTREYEATVVATLEGSDLALVKVDARGLAAVPLGNSDTVEIGDEVYALGCPGGVCGTATMGRIANTGVTIRTEGDRELQGTLMIDVTIDRGSSGGPLVNSRGEVVGITTAGQRGSFGFAIPINQAIPLLQSVPEYEAAQEGASELSFREIRESVGPSTTFVRAVKTISLASVLPESRDGWSLLRGDTFDDYHTVRELWGREPFSYSWWREHFEGAYGRAFGTPTGNVWLLVFCFDDPATAAEMADRSRIASRWRRMATSSWPSPWDSWPVSRDLLGHGREISHGSLDLNGVRLDYDIAYWDGGQAEAGIPRSVNLVAGGSFSLGKLVFVIAMKQYNTQPRPAGRPRSFSYEFREAADGELIISYTSGGTHVLDEPTGLYLDRFRAAFTTVIERVLSAGIEALTW